MTIANLVHCKVPVKFLDVVALYSLKHLFILRGYVNDRGKVLENLGINSNDGQKSETADGH